MISVKVLTGLLVAVLVSAASISEAHYRQHHRFTTRQEVEQYLARLQQLQQSADTSSNGEKDAGTIWAVLVAGSNGWYNYRHQSDVCHAYQILKSHGVAAANIITFMYDDLARDPENPTPGEIINKPGGHDVYKGVVIDYKGDDVTPENFLKALTGDASLEAAGKKVLKSGPNDHVFVYFTDHGATGLLAFPNSVLYAPDLSKALTTMHTKTMYKQLAFYIEACESGSMFESPYLPKSLGIYGLTASNAEESSYACYYDEKRNTYLGDCFSVAWMEDTDAHDIQTETLQVQYLRTKQTTTESHVTQYGDLSYVTEPVGYFQGTKNPSNRTESFAARKDKDAVPQQDVELNILLRKLKSAKTQEESLARAAAIQKHIAESEKLTGLFDRILAHIYENGKFLEAMKAKHHGPVNFDCYRPVVEHFSQNCRKLHASEAALNHLYKLANLCKLGTASERIIEAISVNCA